jgi:hypothetical protein
MPNLPLQYPNRGDIERNRGDRNCLGQLCSGHQIAHGNIVAIDREFVAVRDHEVFDFAVFEFEDKVVALDLDDLRLGEFLLVRAGQSTLRDPERVPESPHSRHDYEDRRSKVQRRNASCEGA